jgi:hypothetical protein
MLSLRARLDISETELVLVSPFGRVLMAIEGALPFLRPNIHLDIQVSDKRRGVVVDPTWW